MSERALVKGAKKPPLEGNAVRLYSMRFCPWSARCRLILLAKNIPHDVININVRRAPDWFEELNPQCTVPVLELSDGTTFKTCDEICQYLDKNFGDSLLPSDEMNKTDQLGIIERCKELFKPIDDVVAGGLQKDVTKNCWDKFHKNMKELDAWYKKKGTKFMFSDEKPGFVDFMIYPIFMDAQSYCDVLPSLLTPIDFETHPSLNAWSDNMGAHDVVRNYMDYFDLVAYNKAVIMDKEYPINTGLD